MIRIVTIPISERNFSQCTFLEGEFTNEIDSSKSIRYVSILATDYQQECLEPIKTTFDYS